MGRLVMDVGGKGFVGMRDYGVVCRGSKRKDVRVCRNVVGWREYVCGLKNMERGEILEGVYGMKVCVCKWCGGDVGKGEEGIGLGI